MISNELAIRDAVSQYLSGAASLTDTAGILSGMLDDVSVIGIAPSESSQLSADENAKLVTLFQLLSERESERHSRMLRVRRILAPNLDHQAVPANALHFCAKLELLAIAQDGLGEHKQLFKAFICTPSWMNEEMHGRRWTWFAPALVVERWDASLIRDALSAFVRTTPGESWQVFQESIVARFAWDSLRVQDVDA